MSNSKLYLFIYVIINHRSKDYNSKSESLSVLCVCIWEDTIMLDWFHFYCEYALFYSMSGIRLVFFRFFKNKLEVGSIILSHSHFIVVCKYKKIKLLFFIQLLSHVQFYETLWTSVHQTSLSFTISQSLLILMFVALLMLSNHLIFCLTLLPFSIFPKHEGLFQWVSSLHQVAKILELQPKHQSLQ